MPLRGPFTGNLEEVRKIFDLPARAHSSLLPPTAGCLPIKNSCLEYSLRTYMGVTIY